MKGPVCLASSLLSGKLTFPSVLSMLIVLFLPLSSSSHFWPQSPAGTISLLISVSLSVSPSSSCFPGSVPLLVLESSLPCWPSPLVPPERPWNSCLAKWNKHGAPSRSYLLWNLARTSAKLERSWQEHNKAAGRDLYFETANKSCKIPEHFNIIFPDFKLLQSSNSFLRLRSLLFYCFSC